MNRLFLLPFVFLPILSHGQELPVLEAPFKSYWYDGKAELSGYALEQAHRGELHKGTAILIFNSEDFSKSKQIKIDKQTHLSSDVVSVLKVNLLKEFHAGLYHYSMMQSSFTPIERDVNPYTFKVSASVQDWSGHIFAQINLQTYKYKVLLHSYLENEGDQEYQLEKVLLEDELWNLIRLHPDWLPQGSVAMIPGVLSSRLRQSSLRVEDAECTLENAPDNPNHRVFTVDYSSAKRRLSIRFDAAFPHTILGWTETYQDNGKELTTRATLKKTLKSDYWNKQSTADAALRKELGLD